MGGSFDLDRIYCVIRDRMIETGQAPHYVELARALGLSPAEGRRALRAMAESPFPCWLHPGTDYMASFAPFSNIPTHHRITVGGEQKWFAQCGFEALAMCWLFPGERVRVATFCLHSGEPLRVEMRDGEVLSAQPRAIHGYVSVPFAKWRQDLPYA